MRRTANVVIVDEGRDKGNCYLITEMSASASEKWAFRALAALAKSGVQVPDEMQNLGMAAIAAIGFQALSGMQFDEAEPLLDEMMVCIKRVPDPSRPQVVRDLIEDDIEEVITRLKLRREVFQLHTDFFQSASRSTLTSETTTTGDSTTTSMSLEQSAA